MDGEAQIAAASVAIPIPAYRIRDILRSALLDEADPGLRLFHELLAMRVPPVRLPLTFRRVPKGAGGSISSVNRHNCRFPAMDFCFPAISFTLPDYLGIGSR
jgi:hypothetical protein